MRTRVVTKAQSGVGAECPVLYDTMNCTDPQSANACSTPLLELFTLILLLAVILGHRFEQQH